VTSDSSDDLFPEVHNSEEYRVINQRCSVRTQERHRVVLVSGMPLAQSAVGDRMSEALAMVNLVDQGWADQNDVAKAFGCSVRTLRRHQRRFEQGGLAALWGEPVSIREDGHGCHQCDSSRSSNSQPRPARGHSQNEIARRLGITVRAVRKTLRRLGWKPQTPVQPELPWQSSESAQPDPSALSSGPASATASAQAPDRGEDPNLSAFSKTPAGGSAPGSLDTDPTDRSLDRLMARLGLLEDAPPLFGSVSALPRAGVLLAIPALVQSGVFDCAQQVYGSLGPAFYGLRTTILTLLLMALWRIKRPEALKEHSPAALGWVMGIDRAPEVKTLRRKLARLALFQRAARFGQALAQRRIAGHGQAFGFLYVDGHVRVYHGRHRLPKAHVARMRLSMPATTDYWVNDLTGDPLFVETATANAGLVKMLPGILEQVRSLVGKRRLTVVFDRGGYSFKLFQQVLAAGFDLLTYRKGPCRRIPRKRFHSCQTHLGGKTTTYLLADQEVRLQKGKLRLRQVTRLAEDGHQTPILTSRRDLSAAQVAYRMFDRWRQENFFK
jgi:prepilin-type processing-associated H-X9-DG protein